MYYREIEPSDDLKHLVLSFWEFAVPAETPSPYDHEIFPDGCFSLFYFRNLDRRLHHVGLSGLQLETITRPVSAGDTFWGMRISPAACAGILRYDPGSLAGSMKIDVAAFPHLTGQLGEKLSRAVDFGEAKLIFEQAIKDLAISRQEWDPIVADVVRIIEKSRGEVRIDDLASDLAISPRQLQRRFKASSGLTPKQFARIRRIRATALVIAEKKGVNWADRAAEMGFSDQSHMAHEFTAITKRSPNSFAEKVGNIEHRDLVK